MTQIFIEPRSVYSHFLNNRDHLRSYLDEVARIDVDGAEPLSIYITEEYRCPRISIEQGDKIIEKEFCVSETDGERVVNKFIRMCEEAVSSPKKSASSNSSKKEALPPEPAKAVPIDTPISEVDEADYALVEKREEELRGAIVSFINTMMGISGDSDCCFEDDEISELLDGFEIMLTEQFGCTVYRPRILEVNGHLKFFEYMYEEEDL